MGHLRPRFNKARQEQMDARRAGKRKAENQDEVDGEAEIIIPRTAAEKDKAARELEAQNASKGRMSAKKKKRMDNYIDKKLKKERRGEIFKSLAASQETMTDTLKLQPSSTLGSRQFKTNQDKLDRMGTLDDRKRQRVYDRVAESKRGYHSDGSDEDSAEPLDAPDSEIEAGPSEPLPKSTKTASAISEAKPSQPRTAASATIQSVPAVTEVGSGLKRGEDGQVIAPTIVKRKRKPIQRRRFDNKQIKPHMRGIVSDDDSFDSSDSANDSSSDAESDEEQSDPSTGASKTLSAQGDAGGEDEEEWGGIAEENAEGEHTSNSSTAEDDEVSAPAPEAAESVLGKRKRGSFKDWAQEQLGLQVRTEEGETLQPNAPIPKRTNVEGPVRGPLGEELAIPSGSLLDLPNSKDGKPVLKKRQPVVSIERSEELQSKRLELPILAEEDTIMEAIRLHSVIVLCGETGSGKTTQVPQFLYEAGFGYPGSENPGMIGITQPRRVAAMSMATRVGQELSLPPSRVSYQIRYDATTSSTTSIKFMTDGVLLRELANDFLLTKYSVLIVDEAHERSVNTDVLIGTLSRVVKLREKLWREGKAGARPLRLIIMSATLRVTDFTENVALFKQPPPLINVAARQHPVVMHFNRKTRPDYLGEAYKKVSKIHARLPSGGILVFLTGQNEISTLCKRLEKQFGPKAIHAKLERRKRIAMGSASWRGKEEKTEDAEQESALQEQKVPSSRQNDIEAEEVDIGYEPQDLAADVDTGLEIEEDPDDLDSDEEYQADDPDGLFEEREEESDTPMHILPLYSLLPTDKQMRVFKAPPEGHRLVVVATNVAETSLTIPNIKYVVDCGLAKERNYDASSGIQSFDVSWISKASASQRAGRAGRTGPGHCYRLYSSNVYEMQFAQHASPEILRMPIEGIVLQMKSMNIDQVINFPFPTPPDRAALQKAERTLVHLGALTAAMTSGKAVTSPARITELGNAMSLFPLSPRFAKMLVVGQQHGCLPYVIAVVSALSAGDPFLRAEGLGLTAGGDEEADIQGEDGEGAELQHIRSEEVKEREVRKLQRKKFYAAQQRHAALGKSTSDVLKMLGVVGAYDYDGGSAKFCEDNFVRVKAMQEIHKLRSQIARIVQANFPGVDAGLNDKLKPPNDTQLKVIRQLLTAAFTDQIAIRKDLVAPSEPDGSKFASTRGIAYRAVGVDEDVFIHPASVLFHSSPPECVVYQELVRTSRAYIRVITKISTAWLPTLGKPLCTFSRVLETAPAVNGSINGAGVKRTAADGSEERDCFVVPTFAGFDGLQLAPIKATQKRVGTRWVFV